MLPSLALAIFERLTGYPLDSSGRAVLDPGTQRPVNRHGSWGFRIPAKKDQNSQGGLSTTNPTAVRNWGRGYQQGVYVPIPVYMEGIDAVKYDDVWPCVTFSKTDIRPGGNPYVYDDPIGHTIGSRTARNPVTGEVIGVYPDQVVVRKHPDPFVIVYTIRCWSKDPIELQWLERCLTGAILPTKGGISVEMADGTFKVFDYALDRVASFEQGEAFDPKTGLGPNQDRYLSTAFTYEFEVNTDNTVQGFGTMDWADPEVTVLNRIIEMQDTLTRLWDGRVVMESLAP